MDHPMADISNAVLADEIANSLLGDELETPEQPSEDEGFFAADSVALLNDAVSDQRSDVTKFGDGVQERRYNPAVSELENSEQEPQEQDPNAEPREQTPDFSTPQAIEEGIQSLEATVQEYELNDPASAKEFAAGFCEAFGTDVYTEGVNVEVLGGAMAKTTLSALNVYNTIQGDPSRIPQMPEASANAFAHDVLKAVGVDPRTVSVDAQLLANTALRGTLNFLDTYQRYGGSVTDLSKLNSAEAAEQFLGGFLRAFGITGPVDRAVALKFADAGGKYILSFLGKLNQIQERNAANQSRGRSGRGRSQGGRGPRVAGGARNIGRTEFAPRFKTNNDIFPASVIDAAVSRNL